MSKIGKLVFWNFSDYRYIRITSVMTFMYDFSLYFCFIWYFLHIATRSRCCMARLLQSYSGYRRYWMPPLLRSLVSVNTSTLHRCFATVFTGCQWPREYSPRLLLWPSTVSEVLVLSTSSKSSAQSRTCRVGQSVRLAAAQWRHQDLKTGRAFSRAHSSMVGLKLFGLSVIGLIYHYIKDYKGLK